MYEVSSCQPAPAEPEHRWCSSGEPCPGREEWHCSQHIETVVDGALSGGAERAGLAPRAPVKAAVNGHGALCAARAWTPRRLPTNSPRRGRSCRECPPPGEAPSEDSSQACSAACSIRSSSRWCRAGWPTSGVELSQGPWQWRRRSCTALTHTADRRAMARPLAGLRGRRTSPGQTSSGLRKGRPPVQGGPARTTGL
jgi:hypothetical protein